MVVRAKFGRNTATAMDDPGYVDNEAQDSESDSSDGRLSDGSNDEDLVFNYIRESLQAESKNNTEEKRNSPEIQDFSLGALSEAQLQEELDDGSDADDFPACPKRIKQMTKTEETKMLRHSGQAYVTREGQLVPSKKFQNMPCGCMKRCQTLVEERDRRHLFEQFWKFASYSTQNTYICNLVQAIGPPRGRHKLATYQYFLPIGDQNMNVCKKFFRATFQMSEGRLTRALKRRSMGFDPAADERGRRIPGNKIEDEQLEIIRRHIDSFPGYQSDYTRFRYPNLRFVNPLLNVAVMFKLYRENCSEPKKSKKLKISPVSGFVYRRVVAKDFHLSFDAPKDPCAICEEFEIKMKANEDRVERVLLKSGHDLHMWRAEYALSTMKADQEASEADGSLYAFAFDLQRPMPFPTLACTLAYYKRSMYVYNCGCHELTKGVGSMYVWDETVASRGSQEVSSCVTKHIRENAASCKHVIMYSNNSPEEFRNVKIALACMKLMEEDNSVELVDHKILMPGHPNLPNQADFDYIETWGRRKIKYSPADWYDVIQKTRTQKPYVVHEMARADFRTTKVLEEMVSNVSMNEVNIPVTWNAIQWLRYSKGEMFKLYYKETLQQDVPFRCINLRPEGVPRGLSIKDLKLDFLYRRVRAVCVEKKKDMEDLLPYIPAINHKYFTSLKTKKGLEDIGYLDDIQVFSKEGFG